MPATHATDRRRLAAAKRRFREFYPGGFRDEDYVVMERLYKWEAHQRWVEMEAGRHHIDSMTAISIESRTNLLFSFEKMALRDAARDPKGSVTLAEGLSAWLHGTGGERERFERWCDVLHELPRRQTRVATWPVVTVFGSIARPKVHLFVKPLTIKRAADAYAFDLRYRPTPGWDTYAGILDLARTVRADLADLRPRDQIDIQSFLWILGSDEYADERQAAA